MPPAVDTELNSEGRAGRGNYRPDLKPDDFVASVFKDLENDKREIGYGPSDGWMRQSRDELDESFERRQVESSNAQPQHTPQATL